MKLCHLIIMAVIFSCCSAYAELSFQFNPKIKLTNQNEIVPGMLEGFEVDQFSDVKLLVGFFEGKSFVDESTKLSDKALTESLFESAKTLDSLNSQTERELVSFKRFRSEDKIIILMKYTLQKDGQQWNEANTYILSKSSSAMASVQFPEYMPAEAKTELLKGMDTIKVNHQAPKTVFNSLKEKVFSVIVNGTPAFLNSFNKVGSLIIDSSYAAQAAGANKCFQNNFVKSGVYSTKPGSALYNFGKLFSSIEEEASKLSEPGQASKDDSRLNCLMNLYKDFKYNAADYWAKQGVAHNCFNEEGKLKGNAEIKDISGDADKAVCREVKNSKNYLDKIEGDFKKFASGEQNQNFKCDLNKPKEEKGLKDLENVLGQVNKNFCCAEKEGPLYQVMEDEYIKKNNVKGPLDNQKKTAIAGECRNSKYSENDKPGQSFLSKEGVVDCIENFMEGAKDLVVSAIHSLSALTDFETIKALGQLVMNLPSSALNILKVMGEQIAAKTYAATNCMSPYDAKQYVCKMVPDVAALLLGPGLIKKFAQAVISKASTTALSQVVSKAISESSKIQKISAAGEALRATVGKVVKPIAAQKYIKPSADILNKIKNGLALDVSSAKDILAKKVKDLRAAKPEVKLADAAAAGTKVAREEVAVAAAEAKAITAEEKLIRKVDAVEAAQNDLSNAKATHSAAEISQAEAKVSAAATDLSSASKESVQAGEQLAKIEKEVAERPAPLSLVHNGRPIDTGALVRELDGRVARAEKIAAAEKAAPIAAVESSAPAPLRLTHNGQPIDTGALVRELDGRVARAEKVAAERVAPIAPVESNAPAPLRLTHNGQPIDTGAVVRELDSRLARAEKASAPKISRENPAYNFEVGEKVAVPRSGGKYSEGRVSRIIDGKDGAIKYELSFETPQGTGTKIISKSEFHKQYDQFYKGEPSSFGKVPTADVPSVKVEAPVVRAETPVVPVEAPTVKVEPIQPSPTNKHGLAESEISSGKEFTVSSSELGKEVKGEIVSAKPFEGYDGKQYVQVKVETGKETRRGHSERGKPTYAYENVSVDDVRALPPKPAPVKAPAPMNALEERLNRNAEIKKAADRAQEEAMAQANSLKLTKEQLASAEKLEKRITDTAEAKRTDAILASKEASYVNQHGVARTDLASGKEFTVSSRELGKEVKGEIVSAKPFEGNDGRQYVQVKVETGKETRPGHSQQGKPTYEYENVPIEEIKAPAIKTAPLKPEAPVNALEERLNRNAEKRKAAEAAVEEAQANSMKLTKEQEARAEALKQRLYGKADAQSAEATAASKTPNYINKQGVARSEISSGKTFKVSSRELGKDVKGEIVSVKPFEGNDGRQYVQVKIETGRETRRGHSQQGKPTYTYENISIDDIAPMKP